jgi:hypothetical protein
MWVVSSKRLTFALLLVALVATVVVFVLRMPRPTVPVTLAFYEHNGLIGTVPVEVVIDEGPPQRKMASCAADAEFVTCRVALDVATGWHTFKVRTASSREWSPWSVTTALEVVRQQ